MELKITKEKVLEAAKGCPSAEGVLKTLFPDAFKKSPVCMRDADDHIRALGSVLRVHMGVAFGLAPSEDLKGNSFFVSKKHSVDVTVLSDGTSIVSFKER